MTKKNCYLFRAEMVFLTSREEIYEKGLELKETEYFRGKYKYENKYINK